MLTGPKDEDVRKLHNECNQIVHQRFILTTLAITVFGVLLTWMVPRVDVQGGAMTHAAIFPFIISLILNAILFALYLWSHLLRATATIFTAYLIETNSTGWEKDWAEFREEPYSAYTKPQAIIFLLLNIVGTGFAFFLDAMKGQGWQGLSPLPIAALVSMLVTSILVYLMAFHGLFAGDTRIAKRWRKLNKGCSCENENKTPTAARQAQSNQERTAEKEKQQSGS